MWLWENHSVEIGVLFAVALALFICALSLAIARFAPLPLLGLQTDVDGIPAMIIATAAYLGGLFGFLQAVTIFAVQLRSQQDSSTLPLTPLIARRYFTFFVLSAIAGVTIANLLAALAAPILPIDRHAFGVLSWLNMITAPAATVAAFWYLAKIVSEAGDDDLDVALPVLRATMRAQAYADAVQAKLRQEFKDTLQAAGIASDQFIEYKLRNRRAVVHRVSLGRIGEVYDMDCHRLDAIAKMLRGMSPVPEVALTTSVGQSIGKNDFLVLTWELPDDKSTTAQVEAPIEGEQQRKIAHAVGRLLAIRRGQGR